MAALSDAVVIGIVIVLIFSAASYYLYSRMMQTETKLGLIENILLNLKMATEASLFSSMNETPVITRHVAVEEVENQEASPMDENDVQQMIDDVHRTEVHRTEVHRTETETEVKEVSVQPSESKPVSQAKLLVVKDTDGNSKVHLGFESMSWKELCGEAKKRNITGVSHMNRRKVIELLNKKEGIATDSAAPLSAWTQQEAEGSEPSSIHDNLPEGSAI